MAEEIKYTKEHLKQANHWMTTGHEKIDYTKKQDNKETKVEDNTDKK